MLDLKLGKPVSRPIRSASTLVVLVLCAAVLTFGGVFYLWQRYQYVRLGFEVDALRAQRTRLTDRIEPLEVEAAYLSRPERIEALARDQLGMRSPRPDQVIVLETQPPSSGPTREHSGKSHGQTAPSP